MKIGFVTSSYPTSSTDPRGIHIHRLAVALTGKGMSVEAVAPSNQEEPYWLDGVKVYPVRTRATQPGHIASGVGGILPSLQRHPTRWLEVPGLIWKLRSAVSLLSEVDLVHAHWLVPGGWAAVTSRLSKPIVLTAHGSDVNILGRYRPLRPSLMKVVSAADRVIGVSPAITERLLGYGADPDRISTMSVGVPRRLPRRTDYGSRDLRILFVGALTASKSVDTLLYATAALESADTVDVEIIGAGPVGDDLEQLKSSLGLDNVVFRGALSPDEVEARMAEADVLVLPSLVEGTPAVIMEAMAAGLAVVASDIPGVREIVKHEVTGFLFAAGSHEMLAGCLNRLVLDRGLAAQMGASGVEAIIDLGLDIDSVASRHIDIYESVVGVAA